MSAIERITLLAVTELRRQRDRASRHGDAAEAAEINRTILAVKGIYARETGANFPDRNESRAA